ncbi:hypothetical protein ADUPG1_004436, partial [Aduncisulcus paluster]
AQEERKTAVVCGLPSFEPYDQGHGSSVTCD